MLEQEIYGSFEDTMVIKKIWLDKNNNLIQVIVSSTIVQQKLWRPNINRTILVLINCKFLLMIRNPKNKLINEEKTTKYLLRNHYSTLKIQMEFLYYFKKN